MNIFKIGNFEVMIDYVHNTDGFKELGEFMQKVKAEVKVGIVGCPGDRRIEDIVNMGSHAAAIFDEIIIRHDRDGRGRTNEEITRLITEGINKVKPGLVPRIISNEIEALSYAIEHAPRNAFIVDCSDDVQNTVAFMTSYTKRQGALTAHEV